MLTDGKRPYTNVSEFRSVMVAEIFKQKILKISEAKQVLPSYKIKNIIKHFKVDIQKTMVVTKA